MKKYNYLVMALATMAFAACSNNDDDHQGSNEPQGELLNAMSISFGVPSVTSRAVAGTTAGTGSENSIYEAFVFAKEAKPTHVRPLDGDWTVIRVTENPTYDDMGRNVDATVKANMKPIPNGTADKQWLVKNVATFHGVRQGDYVYVVANDPELTLDAAEALCHQGPDSEAKIKAYVSKLNKDYINGLAYSPEKNDAAQVPEGKELCGGQIIMAGREQIPVSPTMSSTGTATVVVPLDREVAKVNYRVSVSIADTDAAKGNVEFQAGDGIVVVRTARSVSPFTQKEADFYIPATNFLADWGSAQKTVFDGTTAGAAPATAFNATAPASNVSEYRFTWALDGSKLTDNQQPIYLSTAANPMMYTPMLYVTPNYSNDANCATVICTQATYIGAGSMNSTKLYHAELFWDAYKSEAAFNGEANFTNITWTKETLEAFRKYMTDAANKDAIKTKLGVDDDMYNAIVALYPENVITDANEMFDFNNGDKLYYRCDVSDYVNNVSKRITERNMYYQTTATITSLGAPTIDEAIKSEENTLHVDVVVKDWTLSMNNVNI